MFIVMLMLDVGCSVKPLRRMKEISKVRVVHDDEMCQIR